MQSEEHREKNNEESAGSGTDEAVIETDHQTDQKACGNQKPGRHLKSVLCVSAPGEHEDGCERNHHEHHQMHMPLGKCLLKRGTEIGSRKSAKRADFPVQVTGTEVADGCPGGAQRRGKLVGAGGKIGRQSGSIIGRNGNQSSAACGGVNETRQEDQRTDNEQH